MYGEENGYKKCWLLEFLECFLIFFIKSKICIMCDIWIVYEFVLIEMFYNSWLEGRKNMFNIVFNYKGKIYSIKNK